MHGAADVFARSAQAFAALPEVSLLVEVEGVPTLKEYARVAEILAAAGGVRGVQLAEAAGTRATFAVLTRGGTRCAAGFAGRQRAPRAHRSEGGRQRSRFASHP